MANEIIVLQGSRRLGGAQVLFYLPIDTQKVLAGIPTPSASLPTIAAGILSQAQKNALDAGTAMFVTKSIDVDEASINAEIIARLKEIWTAVRAAMNTDYDERWARAGTAIDAP